MGARLKGRKRGEATIGWLRFFDDGLVDALSVGDHLVRSPAAVAVCAGLGLAFIAIFRV